MARTALSKKNRLETALGPVMSQEENNQHFFQPSQNSNTQENPLCL
jgi:hypothetical protein